MTEPRWAWSCCPSGDSPGGSGVASVRRGSRGGRPDRWRAESRGIAWPVPMLPPSRPRWRRLPSTMAPTSQTYADPTRSALVPDGKRPVTAAAYADITLALTGRTSADTVRVALVVFELLAEPLPPELIRRLAVRLQQFVQAQELVVGQLRQLRDHRRRGHRIAGVPFVDV